MNIQRTVTDVHKNIIFLAKKNNINCLVTPKKGN